MVKEQKKPLTKAAVESLLERARKSREDSQIVVERSRSLKSVFKKFKRLSQN